MKRAMTELYSRRANKAVAVSPPLSFRDLVLSLLSALLAHATNVEFHLLKDTE